MLKALLSPSSAAVPIPLSYRAPAQSIDTGSLGPHSNSCHKAAWPLSPAPREDDKTWPRGWHHSCDASPMLTLALGAGAVDGALGRWRQIGFIMKRKDLKTSWMLAAPWQSE